MVVYASGAPPALARTAPWQDGPTRRRSARRSLTGTPPVAPTGPLPRRPTGASLMTTPNAGPAADAVADLNALLGQLADDPASRRDGGDGAGRPGAGLPQRRGLRSAATSPTSSSGASPPGRPAGSTGARDAWAAHPEAISRLYALWRAWETLRVTTPKPA
ncbi:DUF4913 domain-containing protein [Micromonospora tulbaghiae]|uniref:DUF4913 domain-containing protein n=2 Tax=Micromonospora TaxID=1873 RepID=UPI003B83736B